MSALETLFRGQLTFTNLFDKSKLTLSTAVHGSPTNATSQFL